MLEWTEEEAQRALDEIKKRSATDPEFRALALSNPTAAIAKVNNKNLPAGFQARFIDNSGTVKSFVLPDPIARVEELSDAELEGVAGGDNNNVKVRIFA